MMAKGVSKGVSPSILTVFIPGSGLTPSLADGQQFFEQWPPRLACQVHLIIYSTLPRISSDGTMLEDTRNNPFVLTAYT